jgi:pyruvate/2-oxoglutarate dehydrogenase complex dihydrolipoamide dehydrogenase (E3) component
MMLGDGYIAVECPRRCGRLGRHVSILQEGSQLANREEKEVADVLRLALERDGCRGSA